MSKKDIWHNNDEEERKYPDFIKEAQTAYKVSGSPALARLLAKTQGQYTVEDYYALPDDCRVELIDGVIYNLAAPSWQHQNIAGEIFYYLKDYIKQNNGRCIAGMSPADVLLDKDDKTMVQPDVFVICRKSGKKREEESQEEDTKAVPAHAFRGAPDLAVEVLSPSSNKRDRIIKYRKYKNAGVREYWIVDPKTEIITVHWFGKNEETAVYTYQDEIPVRIFDGMCRISLKDINESGRLLAEMGML